MTAKTSLLKKLTSIFLCMALIVSYIPLVSTVAADTVSRVADPQNMDGWQEFFLPADGSISTENAGGVWTNKSVFTDDGDLSSYGITLDNRDGFLIALSAIASNMSITGTSGVPTDTILVLDASGSMQNMASTLVDAANTSIHALLSANRYNRVGVVLYSEAYWGSGDAVTLLPLDSYATGRDNEYISYSNGTVSVDSNTVIKDMETNTATTQKPSSSGKYVYGATFIQAGIKHAMDEFNAQTDITAEGTARKPVLVLMSDGAPTYGSSNFKDPSSDDMGNGSTSTAALAFVNQLTASYAKGRIEEKYGTKCLFYTLGLGTNNNAIATSVLNPSASTDAVDDYWDKWDDPQYTRIQVQQRGGGRSNEYVTKTNDAVNKTYVNRYFNSSDYEKEGSQSLEDALKSAFAAIVDEIQLQSTYFPTLVEGHEQLSGYITFIDNIGKYMKVTDMKGIVINGNTLFSGAELASNFVAGGGALGTPDQPTAMGKEMISAVKARMGLDSEDTARTLVGLAYEKGQLSYTNDEQFSNYIGWYANSFGEFLGFWYDGITTMPDPSDPTLAPEEIPAYIIRSYGYVGQVNSHVRSDMMYASVQIRESIETGEQTVRFAVPAALIPTVTYSVTLDNKGDPTSLETGGSTAPIRLIYEVALDENINEFTIYDNVDPGYIEDNDNSDGSVNFYTNQYEKDNSTGYEKVNAYSYFRPSRENERYYYQSNDIVYENDEGKPYTGKDKPSGTMYHAYTVYEKSGNSLNAKTVYHTLTAEALDTAIKNTDDTWYIPAGNVRRDYAGFVVNKTANKTDTLPFSDAPFTDIEGHNVDDHDHSFVFGATLGNNGKLTVSAGTGIKLTKKTEGTMTSDSFEFVITNESDSSTRSYSAYKISADGKKTAMNVSFVNGTARVTLGANDVLYIIGMDNGDTITVTETESTDYKVKTVNGQNASGITLTVESNRMKPVEFVNVPRGKGELAIVKEVKHPFGTSHEMPNAEFTIDITLSGVGTRNAEFEAILKDGSTGTVTTDSDGKLTLTLKHDENVRIKGLPEGTVAAIVERDPGEGYEAQYWVDGLADDGTVTVKANEISSVMVVNGYTPNEVYPVNITVQGEKTLTGREWKAEDSFMFKLQKWSADANDWQTLDTQTATSENKTFDFENAFANERYTSTGTYSYRVIEVQPENKPGGIVYDRTVHAFEVKVTDNDFDGYLEINDITVSEPNTTRLTKNEDRWNVSVDFLNTYSATGDTTTVIDISKLVEDPADSDRATLNGFTFGLYDENGDLVYTSAPTTHNGLTRMIINDITEEGKHNYILKEIVPDTVPAGWVYSDKEIGVTIEIIDDGNGVLSADVYTADEGSDDVITDQLSVEFTNKYIPKNGYLEVDFVNKVYENGWLYGEDFTFEIHRYYPETNTSEKVSEGTNDRLGNVIFDKSFEYTKTGIYFYDVFETSKDGNGMTADKNVYRLIVTVSDVEGTLTAKYVIESITGTEITFVNTYSAKPVAYAISGQKLLEGRVLLNDEFTFLLTEAYEDETEVENGKILETKNMTDGTLVFEEITYTQPGAYFYKVAEKKTSGSDYGIIYDETVFDVTVYVGDDGVGDLFIEDVEYRVAAEDADGIVFKNTYKPEAAKTAIPGNKILEGRVLVNGEFTFELYSADESFATADKLQTVKNSADGKFTFDELTFDKIGKYYYVVKEQAGNDDSITYDNTVFYVTVTVTDDLKGKLLADVFVVDSNGMAQQDIEFVNIYTHEEEEIPENPKTGRNGMIWFTLMIVSGGVAAVAYGKKKRRFE